MFPKYLSTSFYIDFASTLQSLLLLFHQIDAAKPVEEVFEAVKAVFNAKDEKVKRRSCAIL